MILVSGYLFILEVKGELNLDYDNIQVMTPISSTRKGSDVRMAENGKEVTGVYCQVAARDSSSGESCVSAPVVPSMRPFVWGSWTVLSNHCLLFHLTAGLI